MHFRAVITDKVTPTLKCKQNKQSTTAILRILEEEKQPQSKNQTELDFSMDCHADKSARNDEKNSLCEKVDSRSEAQNLNNPAQDSRSFNKNAQILHEPQAAGFAMRKQGAAAVSLVNRGFSSACKGAYLAYVTAARAQKSTIYRAKPTPKPNKAESLLKPKVLQLGKFYPPDIGGIESVMQDICDGINARGLICDVLCSSSSYNFSYEILDSRARIYRTKSFGKLASTSITPQMIFTLQKLIKAYDIIHLHLPDPMANLALFLSDIREKIIILHWHSDIIKQKYLLKLYSPLQSWLLQRAHSIIATSPKYALESAFLHPYRDKCVSIPIGIDDIAPSPLESTLPQHPAQSKRGEKKIIFALGRLAQNKGFTYLIQSAQYLPDEYEIHIGGDGALHSKLEALINEHKLSHKVKLLGRITRDKLARHYQQCHIFVLPSIQESYGVVLLEAMSFGKPIISTKLSPSGSDYVNAHNVSGLVVPPRDPAAIAQAISEIERDYERFSRDARARFLQLFTSEKMLDSIYELYCNLYASRENLLGGGQH